MPLPMETRNAWEIEKLKESGGGDSNVVISTWQYLGDGQFEVDVSEEEAIAAFNSGKLVFVKLKDVVMNDFDSTWTLWGAPSTYIVPVFYNGAVDGLEANYVFDISYGESTGLPIYAFLIMAGSWGDIFPWSTKLSVIS